MGENDRNPKKNSHDKSRHSDHSLKNVSNQRGSRRYGKQFAIEDQVQGNKTCCWLEGAKIIAVTGKRTFCLGNGTREFTRNKVIAKYLRTYNISSGSWVFSKFITPTVASDN